MNIQAEKLELVRLIIETDNPRILSSVKRLFTLTQKTDFWEILAPSEQEEILEGIREIENGETIAYEEFISKYRG